MACFIYKVKVFVIIIILAFVFLQGGHCKKKDILKASVQLIEKESKKVDTSSCKSTTETSIVKLRLAEQSNQAVVCLVKVLAEHPDKGWAWSELGHQYNIQNKKSKATTCFKQAAKLTGKLSKFIETWHFIGPFVIGKAEVDGDPLECYGGIVNASKQRYKKTTYYSELLNGGEIHWKILKQKSVGDPLDIVHRDVPWNDLLRTLGSFAILEWQGWVLGEFAVNSKDEDVLIQCLGVHTIFIDGQFVVGDVYRRHQYWYGVSMTQGIHTLYVRLRSKGPQTLQCNLKLAGSNKFDVHSPTMVPDLVDGHLVGSVLAIPITNLQSYKWLKNVRVSLLSQQSGATPLAVTQIKDRGSVHIAPGQTMPVVITFQEVEPREGDQSCTDAMITLKISVSDAPNQELHVTLRCRKRKESFLFTFVDHDGSVQSAAAIQPLKKCPSGSCPVLLSLHGTGVEAQSQADSYKRMEEGKWIFGMENAWVLTPTRHGAHNWEGPGTLTSITALETLQQITQDLSWIENQADAHRVIFAGHSMGGHGAWHLATHYPDRALAVISLAGWIKKEEYGDSNVFFRHDISTSHTDPVVKAIMEACIAENDADRHVTNLKGIPVLARIGTLDLTVHPYFVRRMYRLLQEIGVNITYHELPDKEHWWWDTWSTNDGGAVNDPQLRNFANEVAATKDFTSSEKTALSMTMPSCDAEGLDCPKEDTSLRYSGIENMNHSGKWTLTVMNPALGEGMLGVRILQQTVPFRTSKVQIEFATNAEVELKTVNVALFSLGQSQRVIPSWAQRIIKVDGTILDLAGVGSDMKTIHVCKDTGGKWQVQYEEESLGGNDEVRGPINLGPARRVAEHRFIIVVGTQDKSKSQSQLNMAVYVANLFYLTSDTIAPILDDESLTDDTANSHNLIIIGGPSQNQWTQRFLDKVPLSLQQEGLSLGSCTFDDADLGAVFLAPHQGEGLALVLLGTSTKGLQDVIRLASPTIPPMTRSPFSNMVPDFVLTGPEFQAKGPGGYLCTGFWGNQWEYRRELSSCVC